MGFLLKFLNFVTDKSVVDFSFQSESNVNLYGTLAIATLLLVALVARVAVHSPSVS